MKTHPLFKLIRKPQLLILVPVLLAICWLYSGAPAQTPRSARIPSPSSMQDTCGSAGFAGSWQSLQDNSTSLHILVRGESGEARVSTAAGVALKILRGHISGSTFKGEWSEDLPEGARVGNFIASLSFGPRIDITFSINGNVVENGAWFCNSGAPPGGGVAVTPTPTPEPTPPPEPTPTPIRDDHDQDNFQTFDALPAEQQVAVLTRRGPRLPVEYDASDLSMRILVKEGGPVTLEYGLVSDQFAELILTINSRPIYHRLRPTRFERVSIPIPYRSSDVMVAKLNIRSFTSTGEPADFELYGLAVGERGIQALNNIDALGHEVLLASNDGRRAFDTDYEPLLLFDPMPQSGLAIQIKVGLPTTLRAKQKPENRIDFSCISGGDFSDGRWEWWRVRGLNWRKVWQKGTGGLSRDQTKSEHWNGIITSAKLVSAGSHALQFTAWQKSGNDRDCVVARAPSRLAVIE